VLPRRFPYLDHPGPIPFAHRGGAAEWPENTMAAFAGAYRLGYRYMETDVHATSDGVVVAFHDDKLDRVTDRTGLIAELPWSEVRLARVAGTESIPMLEELFGLGPDVRVNIDVKAEPAIEPLVALLRRTNTVARVCVAGFSERRIGAMRRALGAELCTSMGPLDTTRLRAASVLPGFLRGPVGPRDVPCTQVPLREYGLPVADARFIGEAHRRGVQVHVWTIDDPIVMAALLDLGVDGIMTDRPAVLKTVLTARGQWVD
jgi:glycerophosphoryl diester phosphodiesterase